MSSGPTHLLCMGHGASVPWSTTITGEFVHPDRPEDLVLGGVAVSR